MADLLLAESVHSLAQGKDAQAGSVANLLGDEDGAVPPITVTASPQEGRPITHRVITICPPPAAKLESTAEHCEPAMAAWLRAQLPDLNEVGCRIVLEQKNGSTKPAGSILLSEVLASPMDALGLAQRGASQSGSRLERVLLARARLRSDGKEADKLALDLGTAAQGAALDVDSFGVLLDALRAALDSPRRSQRSRPDPARQHRDPTPAGDRGHQGPDRSCRHVAEACPGPGQSAQGSRNPGRGTVSRR